MTFVRRQLIGSSKGVYVVELHTSAGLASIFPRHVRNLQQTSAVNIQDIETTMPLIWSRYDMSPLEEL